MDLQVVDLVECGVFAANVEFVLDTNVKRVEPVLGKTEWEISAEHCAVELNRIKCLPVSQIPAALNTLFSVYASKAALGQWYWDASAPDYIPDPNFIKSVMKKVFKHIGEGSYSDAYAVGTDERWVLKMNTACKFLKKDAGFDWLMACTSIQHNIFAPKIAALHQIGVMYTAVVEHLVENNDSFDAPDGGCFIDLADQMQDSQFDWAYYVIDMMSYPSFLVLGAINAKDLMELSEVYASVSDSTMAIDDLENFNIMFRGTVPVINDPFGLSKSGTLVNGRWYSWMAEGV